MPWSIPAHALGPGISDGAVARCASGQTIGVERGNLGKTLLDPLVHVAQTLFQAQHFFTDDGKAEMPWFYDPGMNRANWKLVHTIAVHAHKRIVSRLCNVTRGGRGRLAAQGRRARLFQAP